MAAHMDHSDTCSAARMAPHVRMQRVELHAVAGAHVCAQGMERQLSSATCMRLLDSDGHVHSPIKPQTHVWCA